MARTIVAGRAPGTGAGRHHIGTRRAWREGVANAIFGGSAEYVALGLKTLGHESAFFWYVTVMMVVAFFVSLRLPRQASYLHHDH